MRRILCLGLILTLWCWTAASGEAERVLYYVQDFKTYANTGYASAPKENPQTGQVNTAQVVQEGEEQFYRLDKTFQDPAYDCHVDFNPVFVGEEIVLEAKVRVKKSGARAQLFYVRDGDLAEGRDKELMYIDEQGTLRVKTQSAALSENRWYQVSVALNLKEKTYRVFLDGTLLLSDANLDLDSHWRLSMFRFRLHGEGIGTVELDDVKVYSGSEPRDTDGDVNLSPEPSVFPSDTYSVSLLEGKRAVQGYSSMLYTDEKKATLVPTQISGGEVYLNLTDLGELLGAEVSSTEQEVLVGGVRWMENCCLYEKDGIEVPTDYMPIKAEGVWLLPVETAAKSLNLWVYNDLHGLIVVSEKEFTYSRSQGKEVSCYLSYERPKQEQLLQMEMAAHPRLLVSKERFAAVRESTEQRVAAWREQLINEADQILDEDPCTYFIPDGLRLLSVSQTAVDRLMKLGFAYQMTGDSRYSQRAWEEIYAVCQFPDWNAYRHFLDAAEMSFAVGIGFDWMYDAWNVEQKERMVQTIKAYGLLEADKVYTGAYSGGSSFWATTTINWNGVCNGGIGAAALAVWEEDPQLCAKTLENALRSLEYAWYEIGPDGAWEEGVGYWGYFLRYAIRLLSTLSVSLGEDFSFFHSAGVDKIGYYPTLISSPQGCNNFHDTGQKQDSIPALHYLSQRLGNPDFTAIRLQSSSVSVEDALWYAPVEAGQLHLEPDVYFRESEIVTMRKDFQDGAFVSFHGGQTTGGHNHYDGGTFVFDAMGERWASDLGADDYNLAAEYGKEALYRNRAEGHNTLVIDPSQEPGQLAGFSPVIRTEFGQEESMAVLDLTEPYRDKAERVVRGFYLGDGKGSLEVRDEIQLKGTSVVYWFMHTTANVKVIGERQLRLIQNGKSVLLSVETNCPDAVLTWEEAVPMASSPVVEGQADNGGYRKVSLRLEAAGAVTISVKLVPEGQGISLLPQEKSIDEWTVTAYAEDFSHSQNAGCFGKDVSDRVGYGEQLELKTPVRKLAVGESALLRFYIALKPEYETLAIHLNCWESGRMATAPLLSFSPEGELFVFGKKVVEKGWRFPAEKWYKVDFKYTVEENGTLASLWLDHQLMAENIFLEDRLEKIDAILFEKMYVDDVCYIIGDADPPKRVSLVHGDWNVQKNLCYKRGLCLWKEGEVDLGGFGTVGVRSIQKRDNTLLLTTAQQDILYMPLLEYGELIIEGTGQIDINRKLDAPVTVRMELAAEEGNCAAVQVDGEVYPFAKLKANGVMEVGGREIAQSWSGLRSIQLSVTVYPGDTRWDISVAQTRVVAGEQAFLTPAQTLEGAWGKNATLLCYTGGPDHWKYIGPLQGDGRSVSVTAASLQPFSAVLVLAAHRENRLVDVTLKSIDIEREKQTFSVWGDDLEQTMRKAMLLEDLFTLQPLTDAKMWEDE